MIGIWWPLCASFFALCQWSSNNKTSTIHKAKIPRSRRGGTFFTDTKNNHCLEKFTWILGFYSRAFRYLRLMDHSHTNQLDQYFRYGTLGLSLHTLGRIYSYLELRLRANAAERTKLHCQASHKQLSELSPSAVNSSESGARHIAPTPHSSLHHLCVPSPLVSNVPSAHGPRWLSSPYYHDRRLAHLLLPQSRMSQPAAGPLVAKA